MAELIFFFLKKNNKTKLGQTKQREYFNYELTEIAEL